MTDPQTIAYLMAIARWSKSWATEQTLVQIASELRPVPISTQLEGGGVCWDAAFLSGPSGQSNITAFALRKNWPQRGGAETGTGPSGLSGYLVENVFLYIKQ